jgi:hypothetical protein
MDAPKVDAGPDKTVRKTEVAGIPVNIERPKGVVKVFPKGYTQLYKVDYGSTPLAKGVDGDPLDIFVGPDKSSKTVFVVDKMTDKDHSAFDEHKVLLGFRSKGDARDCVKFHLWGTDGKIKQMSIDNFLKSIRGGVDRLGKQAAALPLERGSMIDPWQVVGFMSVMGDEKTAFSLADIPREVWGGLAGGALGGLGGYGATSDPLNKKRNTVLGALGGAAAGAGLAHLTAPDAKPDPKFTSAPGTASPVKPGLPEQGKLPSAQVEPTLQRSEAAVRQQAQQQMTQQAVQFSAARERASLLKDQGQVMARTQALLAPREAPTMPKGVPPRNMVLAPGGRVMFQRVANSVAPGSLMGKAAALANGGAKLDLLRTNPKLALAIGVNLRKHASGWGSLLKGLGLVAGVGAAGYGIREGVDWLGRKAVDTATQGVKDITEAITPGVEQVGEQGADLARKYGPGLWVDQKMPWIRDTLAPAKPLINPSTPMGLFPSPVTQ